ncbi:MAG TPA: alpha/beta hydrolase [Anaerolineales bacterium]|nr:alpha/beta hydrolase [Anaerolineales bacterium]
MNLPAYHPFRTARAKEEHLALYDLRAQQWPVASETRMVETSYGQTFVRISGAANEQPLILLHGASANSLMWMQNAETLSTCYKIYAVDNIYDYGRSVYTRPIKGPDGFVNWLDELFTTLSLGDQIYLMGMSYGGWLTSLYALRFPNHIAKIVIMAPAATVLPMRLEFWIRALLSGLHHHLLKNFLYWLLGDGVYDKTAQKLVEEGINDVMVASRCFKPKAAVVPTVLTDQELQGLQMPALYVVGEHEKIYSAQKAVQRLKTVAPQIKTEIIPGVGHNVVLVQAEMVNRKVLEFLKQP